MVNFRKKTLNVITTFYEKKFNEKDIPHLYACAIMSIFDFIYLLNIKLFFNLSFTKMNIIVSLVILFGINFLIFNYIPLKNIKNYRLYNVLFFLIGPCLILFQLLI